MPWWKHIDRLLTPRRTGYARLAGAALWFAWLASTLLGPGNFDLTGQVIGTDFLQFYTAGVTLLHGDSDKLYNFEYQSLLQQGIIGPSLTAFHAFITPPFLGWVFVPFALLPYTLSFTLWSLLGLLCLWICFHWLDGSHSNRAFGWALTFFPVFATISFGQNSLLSLFLLCLTYAGWRKNRLFLSGLTTSLLLYKPQLVLGIALLWLLEWRRGWKALLGLAVGGIILMGVSLGSLPAASKAYLEFSRNVFPTLINWKEFPLWHAHTSRAFWLLLLPAHPGLAEVFSLTLSAIGVFFFILFWRYHRLDTPLLFAGAISLTLWITPHAMIYDWTLLLIPAAILWENKPQLRDVWKVLFSVIWVAALTSGPLTYIQLGNLPIAIQISVPILAFVLISAYSILIRPSKDTHDVVNSISREHPLEPGSAGS